IDPSARANVAGDPAVCPSCDLRSASRSTPLTPSLRAYSAVWGSSLSGRAPDFSGTRGVLYMHYVLLATHSAETCPLSNAKTKNVMLQVAPDIPAMAQKAGVALVAGPFVSREHMVVTIVDADRAESVDQLLEESRLSQWNSVRVVPSLTMEEGMEEIQRQTP